MATASVGRRNSAATLCKRCKTLRSEEMRWALEIFHSHAYWGGCGGSCSSGGRVPLHFLEGHRLIPSILQPTGGRRVARRRFTRCDIGGSARQCANRCAQNTLRGLFPFVVVVSVETLTLFTCTATAQKCKKGFESESMFSTVLPVHGLDVASTPSFIA